MLFTLKDLKTAEEVEKMASHPEKCAKYISEIIDSDLSRALGTLQDGHSYHFDTGTKWSLHDIVIYIVKQIGPCELYLSTYAIKEYQARLLTGMKSDGLVNSLTCLLDYRTPVQDGDAVQLLEKNCTQLGFTRTHSKLTVIVGKNLSAVITGSANYTNNTNADTGVITCVQEIAKERIQWILKNIAHGTK